MTEIKLDPEDRVESITFGKDSKFMIVQYPLKLEIYKV